MKRTFILITFLLVGLQSTSFSQVMGVWEPIFNFGLKIGANFQTISGAPVTSGPGVMAGVYGRKDLKRFGVRGELLGGLAKYVTQYPASFYSLKTPGMDTVSKGDFQAIYLYIPILLEYKLNVKMTAMAGPQFNYVASLADNNNAYTKIYGDGKFIKKTEVAVVGGIEYSAGKRVRIGGRAMIGVTDINNSTYYLAYKKWSTVGAQLYVSYKIM